MKNIEFGDGTKLVYENNGNVIVVQGHQQIILQRADLADVCKFLGGDGESRFDMSELATPSVSPKVGILLGSASERQKKTK